MSRFPPVRVRGGRYPLRRLVRHRRRAVAAGLAVTAAALVAAGPGDTAHRARGHPPAHAGPASAAAPRPGADRVTVPVRIADGATVRLLRPGDRVDVIAAEDAASGGRARVVARRARVTQVPAAEGVDGSGALVVLSVPRGTAARLAGAGATARLAVTLW
ncbi:hypothetical protein ACLGIH_19330 [Streptomyces sp. HMX87]|uniref:hypothetical protein n=1 Tax=Streptomyces sp. HMX87 TaxID=3390849 RepID=UPI003A8560E8